MNDSRFPLRRLAVRSLDRWPALGRLGRPLRFGVVGLIGMAMNTLVLWLLVNGAQLALLPASAIATEVAIINNFVLNNRWTFSGAGRQLPVWLRLLRFNGVALGGMLITMAVLAVLVNTMPIGLIAANIIAVGAATAWNYLINSRWTWR